MADINKNIKLTADASQAKEEIKGVKDALEETSKAAEKASKKTNDIKKMNFDDAKKSMVKLTDSFKAGEIGLKGLIKGVLGVGKALVASFGPILIPIAAVSAVLFGLFKLFKNFEPVADKVQQVVAKLTATFRVLGDAMRKLSFKGLGKDMKNAANEAERLTKIQQELYHTSLQMEITNKKNETQIKRLIAQSKDVAKTDQERINLLNEAIKIEEENLIRRRSIAKQEAELAFGKMTNFRKLNDEQIAILTGPDSAAAHELKSQLQIKDEQFEIWVEKLNKQEEIEQQSLAITEEANNQRSGLLNSMTAKEEAELAKRKAAYDKLVEDRKKKEADELAELKKIQDKKSDYYQWEIEQDIARQEREDAAAQKKADEEKAFNEAKKQQKADFYQWEIEQDIARQEREDAAAQKAKEDAKELQDAKIELAFASMEAIAKFDEAFTQGSINLLDKKLQSGKISQEEYDKKVQEIEIKAAKRQKVFAIAGAIMNTANAIMSQLSNPTPFVGPVLAAAAGVLGAAQIATIMATPVDGSSIGSAPATPNISKDVGGGTTPNTSFSFSSKNKTPEPTIVKTYVLNKDIENQQQLERETIANATI